jgi:hypothetical protein
MNYCPRTHQNFVFEPDMTAVILSRGVCPEPAQNGCSRATDEKLCDVYIVGPGTPSYGATTPSGSDIGQLFIPAQEDRSESDQFQNMDDEGAPAEAKTTGLAWFSGPLQAATNVLPTIPKVGSCFRAAGQVNAIEPEHAIRAVFCEFKARSNRRDQYYLHYRRDRHCVGVDIPRKKPASALASVPASAPAPATSPATTSRTAPPPASPAASPLLQPDPALATSENTRKRHCVYAGSSSDDDDMPPPRKRRRVKPPIPAIYSCSTCGCARWKLRDHPLRCKCPTPDTRVERLRLTVANNVWSGATFCHPKAAGKGGPIASQDDKLRIARNKLRIRSSSSPRFRYQQSMKSKCAVVSQLWTPIEGCFDRLQTIPSTDPTSPEPAPATSRPVPPLASPAASPLLQPVFETTNGEAHASDRILSAKNRGNLFYWDARYPEALKCFRDGLRFITSEDTRELEVALRSDMAQCLLRMEDFVAAQAECNIVLQLDPTNSKVLYRRALTLEQLGLFAEAIEDVQECLAHIKASSGSPLIKELQRASHRALYRLRGRVQHVDARSKKKFKTRHASRVAFHLISDVSCIDEAAEVPNADDLHTLPDLDDLLISAQPTALEPASPASTPSTPPPTAPPPVSRGIRGRFKKEVAPAAVRRSVRIAAMQPPRRSPRLAALPRINYRL